MPIYCYIVYAANIQYMISYLWIKWHCKYHYMLNCWDHYKQQAFIEGLSFQTKTAHPLHVSLLLICHAHDFTNPTEMAERWSKLHCAIMLFHTKGERGRNKHKDLVGVGWCVVLPLLHSELNRYCIFHAPLACIAWHVTTCPGLLLTRWLDGKPLRLNIISRPIATLDLSNLPKPKGARQITDSSIIQHLF